MYKISQNIIDETTKCDKDYECLKEGCKPSCKVSDCVNCKIIFVEKLERHCPYFLSFGKGHVCLCPVRKEIYLKYGE